MSYNNNSYDNIGCGPIIIVILIMLVFIFGTNLYVEPVWNQGICPQCEIRYELRGVSRGLKYYACPECGQEVERF